MAGGDPQLEQTIRVEASRAIRGGALFGVGVAALATVGTVLLALRDPRFWTAVAFPAVAAVGAAGLWALGRANAVHGRWGQAYGFAFSALPALFLLVYEAWLPFGAATFFFGPIALAFFIVVALTGFNFQPRYSRAIAAWAAALYFLVYAWVRPHLATIEGLDPTFRADLLGWEVQGLRSLLLFGVGLVVASMAQTARRLVVRIREEERERAQVSQLFGQYVSPEVKEKLVREKADVQGERKTVAVLFSDLRGFTSLAEGRAPAEVVARLNRYFDRMVKAIAAQGGTVDKFIGDAVMATFGGLVPLENPAEAALDAALAMRRQLAELNADWAREGVAPLESGIGLHYGEVLQGPIGSTERKEFTVIGDVVNTASRLESATKDLGATIVCSAALVAALPEARRAALTPLGDVKLKGKALQVTVFGA